MTVCTSDRFCGANFLVRYLSWGSLPRGVSGWWGGMVPGRCGHVLQICFGGSRHFGWFLRSEPPLLPQLFASPEQVLQTQLRPRCGVCTKLSGRYSASRWVLSSQVWASLPTVLTGQDPAHLPLLGCPHLRPRGLSSSVPYSFSCPWMLTIGTSSSFCGNPHTNSTWCKSSHSIYSLLATLGIQSNSL